jgi:hypothetical protein
MEQCQPEALVIGVFPAKIKFQDIAQAVAGKRARFHNAVFDALDGTRADFTVFRQFFLGESLLLAQLGNFESNVGLVHASLLLRMCPHYRKLTKIHNVISTTLARHRIAGEKG